MDRKIQARDIKGLGAKSGEVQIHSSRWLKLEIDGDIERLKKHLVTQSEKSFSGDLSIRIQYREQFHMLARYTRKYVVSDLFSNMNNTLSDDQKDRVGNFDWMNGLSDLANRKRDIRDQLQTWFPDFSGGQSDDRTRNDFMWMIQPAIQQGMDQAKQQYKGSLVPEDPLLDLIDQQLERSRNSLDQFINEILNQIEMERSSAVGMDRLNNDGFGRGTKPEARNEISDDHPGIPASSPGNSRPLPDENPEPSGEQPVGQPPSEENQPDVDQPDPVSNKPDARTVSREVQPEKEDSQQSDNRGGFGGLLPGNFVPA